MKRFILATAILLPVFFAALKLADAANNARVQVIHLTVRG